MSYTTVVKMTHRAGVCELAKNDKERRPILYLEHEDAAATHYFKEHGVGKRSLVPVNKNRASCARIKKLAGVPAVQADMRELVEAYDIIGQRFSVVWLDFQSRIVEASCIQSSLNIAPYVCITLASRGGRADDLVRAAVATIVKCGGRVLESPTRYCGKSNITNVMRILVKSPASSPAWTPSSTHMSAFKPTPLKPTPLKPAALKPAALINRVVTIPVTQWRTDEAWFSAIKRKREGFCFRVVGTHYRNRLRVRAIRKDNRLHEDVERWTLTPAQVVAYSKF